MLIFTYKLETYIRKNILPKLLLVPNKYVIKGSFRRRIPYITDIDVVNNVYPEINENNMYEELLKLFERIRKDQNVILVYITCGIDDRFKINTGSSEELSKIKSLLDKSDIDEWDIISEKYADNLDKKLFYITEIIWKYYKLRWTPTELISNKKILRGDKTNQSNVITFTETIKKNTSLLLQYYVKIESYMVGVDIVANYKLVDMKNAYIAAAEYQLKLANYSKEYYFMLFPFKQFFRNDKNVSMELENVIEKKFGLYKQLLVRIDTYRVLYQTNNLDIRTATSLVTSLVKDVNYLPGFQSNTINKIQKVAMNNPPDVKMHEWFTLLGTLYDEINSAANLIAKDYFFKYLEMLPSDIRNKYFLNIRR